MDEKHTTLGGGSSTGSSTLLVRTPEGVEETIRLGKEPFTIGRRSTNDLQLLHPSISREHARIVHEYGGYWIEDVGSTHGTYVDGEAVDRVSLGHNQVIRLGNDLEKVLVYQESSEITQIIETSSVETDESPGATASFRTLLEISKALNSSLRLDDVLGKVMEAVMGLTRAERGLLLLGDSADELEVEVEQPVGAERGSEDYSHSVVREVFTTGESQILTDVSEDEKFRAMESIVELDLRTVMSVPLTLGRREVEDDDSDDSEEGSGGGSERIIGVIYVDRQSPIQHFTDEDLELLESLASHAAIAIENARLYEEALEKRRMDEELDVARSIQKTLLRSEVPEIPWLQIHAFNEPSRGVAGDYYEVIAHADGSAVFAVGDVSGKGIPAAFLMAVLQSAFLAAQVSETDLATVCANVNEFLVERTTPERYSTFFAGRIVTDEGSDPTFSYVNAGHNPQFLIRDGEATELVGGGLPLGLFPDQTYELQETPLQAGDLLVCYTDGVTEATDPDGEEFGVERLLETVVELPDPTAEEVGTEIYRAVDRHVAGGPGRFDDLTVVVLRV